ncbi:MAG: 6-carboxytetrahydropterin synthase [Verrucomicrobiales bacterium]|nr:6-carboxytetrahydropterin synthase [Verrucomicrobiae bacterium]MCP5553198.1 6-carboxytetrahydropterin synthase [Akkermansiaceae bacterium]HRX53623.1 6-carboxytetrahydropterin synthase [Verrucomicrobiales bacterium]
MTTSQHDFTLRFSRRYSMAHRLTSGAAPACSVPHGHDEVVTVEIVQADNAPLDPATNMLVEFDVAKRRWFEWIDRAVDHSFHLHAEDPLVSYFRTHEPNLVPRLLLTPGDPTTEMRALCFKSKLQNMLDAGQRNLVCQRLTIQETPTNAVVCEADRSTMERLLPTGSFWWHRPDPSINDL